MGCFRCSQKSIKELVEADYGKIKNRAMGNAEALPSSGSVKPNPCQSVIAPDANHGEAIKDKEDLLNLDENAVNFGDICKGGKSDGIRAQTFAFGELKAAAGDFRKACFLGEGGFGKVYRGHLERIGQEVAIKRLDRNGVQGVKEFIVEVTMLSLADHPNLVKLIGFCAEKDQKLLVYEYMPLGSLEAHLHDLTPRRKALDWDTRMKIAAGAAQGLEYLHDKLNPPIIYRDLKCSNILLGEGYHPKLSDFGLAKVGPSGDRTHVSTRVMGTYGYCAPDYAMTGQLTFKSDIYSFGVVLLELITGKKAYDPVKDPRDQYLVAWVRHGHSSRTGRSSG
ncbi:hypothetical protein SAY86_002645 [Trapa natans]|uniref:Protein kinase domain-containing protein n=1 Tax=Trapa natans TaxID=22666 RepID=A0AAN7R3K6_TRANT|nr:hypothetical protein SAY86_002645 [Trapa natans]